ncbi:bis-aminopropyl spermidine synthase family protein [Paenibacillus puerhi]|uniref:bis-aminopropyl spermidine synthase family protein n=1 Tax=Paenibacillus puerhi TaxID=2692622 RepID=UPI00135C43BF|nr:bis-aminopropyl spermidine synthase family protein [Paenibacillus puerhi]
MNHFIDQASRHVRLNEGTAAIEQLLLECYLHPGISTKELARKALLPIPVAAAIKRELIKTGAIRQDRGVRCTAEGTRWIEEEWGYHALNKPLHQTLMDDDKDWICELKNVLSDLKHYFSLRPQADVRIDQSQCTAETSLRRAILGLRQHALIGKRILCVGDDDLVSVSIALLMKRLFPEGGHTGTTIDVVDIDERFLAFIGGIAEREKLPIRFYRHDLRQPLPAALHASYDCFYTDPPYTLSGMNLFVSRGIRALKTKKGLPIFLSFAHKSPEFMLDIQRDFIRMGLTVCANYPRFNTYEGAEMIANRSQMFLLRTTDQTAPECAGIFTDALYTGEVRQTLRTYCCKQCGDTVFVGAQGDVQTIEQLKNQGCSSCGSRTFDRVETKRPDP